jgi:hypothetical protein
LKIGFFTVPELKQDYFSLSLIFNSLVVEVKSSKFGSVLLSRLNPRFIFVVVVKVGLVGYNSYSHSFPELHQATRV